MAPIVDKILSLFATPQGNVIIFLVLVLFSFGAFQACAFANGSQESIEKKRMRQGLLSLLVAQILLFLAGWLAWVGVIDEHAFLPVLDRVVALFSLVVIIWLWAFPKRTPVVDRIVLIIEAIILLAGVFSLIWWLRQNTEQFFNTSFLGAYAYYGGIALLLAGLILLIWKRPKSWGLGVTMLVIFLAGYLFQFILRQPVSDYAWLVRLGEMFAFVLLLEMPRRLLTSPEESPLSEGEKSIPLTVPRTSESLIQSIVNLSQEKSPQQYYLKMTHFVAQLMQAESCFLVVPPKSGAQMIVLMGYSFPDGRIIDGFTIDGQKTPLMIDGLRTGKILRIEGNKPDTEVKYLTSELELSHTGHLLSVPFRPKGSEVEMGLIVLSKPSQPEWSEEDGSLLMEISNELSAMVPQPDNMTGQNDRQGEGEEEIRPISEGAENLDQEFTPKASKPIAPAIGAAIGIQAASALADDSQKLRDTIDRLEEHNRELELLIGKGRPSIEEVEQLREELRAALIDLAHIPSTLSKSDQKMLELQLLTIKRLDDISQTELVTSIAQEFRQPLSAIIGYTDLLLAESAGLLGEMQCKFLERVKASTERLGILMDELVQVLTIDTGKVDQTLDTVDLEAVVDDAVGNIIAQISEKNITMRVDLPEKLPEICANQEAIRQILANLLENACIVTPEDGEIRLFARVERNEKESDLLHISITDQGGGIDKEDISRVFSRRYKVENPLIDGIGDTGVGLSIVKSLVELHKGRVWVETSVGIGSTFSILIPLLENQPETVNSAISKLNK
jgi:signal transduction histidine kinase